MTRTRSLGLVALVAYVASILLANHLTNSYGMVSMGFGLTATAGTFAAGAALLLRDAVQDGLGRVAVLAGIASGAALTAVVAPSLALASAVAFGLAELADMLIYTPLRARGWAKAVIVSNIVGAIVDTYVFLRIAGFPITEEGVAGQLVGKLFWATAIPVALVVVVRGLRRRA